MRPGAQRSGKTSESHSPRPQVPYKKVLWKSFDAWYISTSMPSTLDPCPVLICSSAHLLTCSPAHLLSWKIAKRKKKKLTALCIPRWPVQSHTCWPLALTFKSAPKSDKPGMAGFRVQESRAARPRHRETVRVAHNPVVPRVLPDLVFSQADRHPDRQPDRQRLPRSKHTADRGRKKLGLSEVGFEPTPPGETAT